MQKNVAPIQLRVINVMKAWIENSFFDFDAALLSRVEAFVEQNSDNASMQLLRNTIAKQKSNKTTTEKLYQHLFVHSDQDVPKKTKKKFVENWV